MQKQPWLKDMLLSTNHIPCQSSKRVFNCLSGWGLLSLFPNNIAFHCQSYQELNVHLPFDPQIPVQDEIPSPEHLPMCSIPIWVGFFTVCWLKFIVQQGWGWMHPLPQWVLVPISQKSGKTELWIHLLPSKNASDKPNSQSKAASWAVQPSRVFSGTFIYLYWNKTNIQFYLHWHETRFMEIWHGF